jgi:hypothetical protein
MSQVSMPMRILFLVLKPGSSSNSTSSKGTTSTTQTSPGSSAGTVSSGAAVPLAPLTEQFLSTLPAPVASALRDHRVLVVLFTNGGSAVDLIDQSELATLNQGGSVVTTIATPDQMANYGPIAIPTAVQQTPSFVIINPAREAVVFSGFVDTDTLNLQIQAALAVPAPVGA